MGLPQRTSHGETPAPSHHNEAGQATHSVEYGNLSKIGVTDGAIEYWDYFRLTDIEGVETEEFIFVEMNKDSGWFEIWRGFEVATDRITVL